MSSTGAISGGSSQLAWQVDLAVAKKTLNTAKAQGAAVVSLLRAAADLQQKMTPAAQPGRVDVSA